MIGFSSGTHLNSLPRLLLMWTFVCILVSCTENELGMDFNLKTEPSLVKYFDRFESEARKRGHRIDLKSKNIYGVFGDLDEDVIGNCKFKPEEPRQVTIDRQNWEGVSELEREYIVFHELGHCYLERIHDDRKDANGRCLSIMHSAEGKCILEYNMETRDTYLQELFTF
ncbi:MAG TPA: hypothetical protein VKZ56_02430 [Membranihabitans sp.]|nr:hypothetical protein [Membranihabitans sp.]